MNVNKNKSSKKDMNKFESLFKIENLEEKVELKASIIQLDILYEISELMKKNHEVSNRTALARRLGKSKGFVSQLFSGDKALNLKMIAQLQEIFDVKFIPSFKDNNVFRVKNTTKEDYSYQQEYSKENTLIFAFPNGKLVCPSEDILAA